MVTSVQDTIPIAHDTIAILTAKVEAFQFELEASVIRLNAIEKQNTFYTILIITIVIAVLLGGYFLIKKRVKNNLKLKNEQLANKILKQSISTIPSVTNKIGALSSRSLRLSESLYNEFQSTLGKIKSQQKSNISIIVNDAEFKKQYPYIQNLQILSANEKIITILYEEDFKPSEIAQLLGTTDNNIRAIKAKIKAKLSQSTYLSQNINLKILK